MSGRYVDKATKAKVVGRALATSVLQAAEEAGIPETTVRGWVKHPDYADLRDTSRDEMADAFWIGVQVGVSEVVKGLRDPNATLRDKVIAVGVLYDKHALLTGAATSRTESRDLTGSLPDEALIAAVREAERVTGEGGAAPAAAGTPEG